MLVAIVTPMPTNLARFFPFLSILATATSFSSFALKRCQSLAGFFPLEWMLTGS